MKEIIYDKNKNKFKTKEIVYNGNSGNFLIDGEETFSTTYQNQPTTKGFATKLVDLFINYPFSVFIVVLILYYIMNTSIFLETFYKNDITFDSNLTNVGHIKFGFHLALTSSFIFYIYKLLQ